MLKDTQKNFDEKVQQIAENNLINKLNKQGINKTDISDEKFAELLDMEIEILKSDGKKVGAGIAVGIGISFLTGGLF